ncbi:1-hydroxycarotenoid 3,4-desaturase CrtD [Glacieibacterium sp.]|uniref:1-hydroxycarotenoid 3,4-desaturase CrtD n=1 Tax=Glacieibacterium sp. TaxID=2860237 RepID=UPI003B00B0EE
MMPRDCCRVTALQCWLMPQPRVIVIGAGIGGLTAAALLAAQGCAVTVLERAATPGGKLRQVDVGGALIDAGPTVFTMRWVFDEIFETCGFALDDYLTLTKADILARHAWSATERLDLFADEAASADAIGIFAGASEARGFLAFMTEARRMLSTLDEPFLRRAATGPLGLTTRIGIRRISDLIAIHPYARLWDRLGVHFKDDRLRQLFGRYATYSGSSPFASPATLSLIAAVEAAGVWLIDEGMYALARALEDIGSALSITFRYCTAVQAIAPEKVSLVSGEFLEADVIVFNGDPQALASRLLGESVAQAVPRLASATRSLSALVWTLLTPATDLPLVRHNVLFSRDYKREFDELAVGKLPSEPSVYICAQDRSASHTASFADAERLQIIVNAPALGDVGHPTQGEIESCSDATFAQLARCGLTLDRSAGTLATPSTFASMFPGTGGALYGAATHGSQAAFRRPGARTKVRGLYLAGGATHPGAGVPMAALSGIQAAAAVLADWRGE